MFNKKESLVVYPSDQLNQSAWASDYERVKTIAIMLCNLHDLGYTIPQEDLDKLLSMSAEDIDREIYKPLLTQAKEAKGAHVEHRILFPGFPESVKTIDIDTLSDIRFVSYFTTIVDRCVSIDALSDGSITRNYVEAAVQRALDNSNPNQEVKISGGQTTNKIFFENARRLMNDAMEYNGNGFKEKTPRAVRLVGQQEYFDMVKNMLSARTSLSQYDK
jgi:hypothetical protein